MSKMLNKLKYYHVPTIIFILLSTIFNQSTYIAVNSITCYCDHCPESECQTIGDHKDSTCYKSIQKSYVNGSFQFLSSFGCLSAGDGLLSHLQCTLSNIQRHGEPTFIACCKDSDYCNDYLPDPDPKLDPRWDLELKPTPTIPPEKDRDWTTFTLTIGIFSILIMLSLKIAISLYKLCRSKEEPKEQQGSTFSLSNEILEKLNHAASSSVSTQSYSISDDLCHKPSESPHIINEESFIPQDLTSGLGERMLNQRTMARAVGFGKTDHVGNGRFGRVFRGQYHGEDVAVKAFRTIDQDSWKREDDIFRALNHENIVRFIASELTSLDNGTTEIWMFLEYCQFGSLSDYLDHHEIMGPQQAVKILYSIINGLNYLHEDYAQASRLYKPSIAHRDIKSKNILMKSPDCCCIADFGHALVKLGEGALDYGKYQHLQVGTIRYMAPEILKPVIGLNYRQFSTFAQADLYQYGLILWEVCHRTALDILHPAGHHKLPYDGVVPQNPDIQDMIKIVCDDQYRPPRYEKWDKYPLMRRLADLMVECWRPNSKARMETLGMKKKLREMHDQVNPPITQHYQLNLYNNLSISYQFRNDKTKSTDVTL